MSERVPEGWNKAPLNKYVTRIRTPLEGEPENVLTISSTAGWVDQREKWARNMAGESLKKYTCLTRGELSYNRGNSKTFPYGCVFKLNRWSSAAVPNVYHSFRVIDGKADPDFVQYAFHGGTLDYQLRQIITSSARANGLLNITAADFFEIELIAPPLPEQQKIAKILTSVDEVIEKTQAQIDKLKDLKTGMMQELLTKGVGVDGKPHTEFRDSPVGRIPKAWSVVAISSLCSHIVDCVNKTAPVVDSVTPYKMLRTSNIRHGRVDTKNVRYVTEDTYKNWTRRLTPAIGDLIFTREAPVGECGVLEDADGVFLGQRTMMYRADLHKTTPHFLMYSLMSEYGKKQLEDFSGGSTVPHMRVPDCEKILIKVPPKTEQDLIVDAIRSVDRSIYVKQLKAHKLADKKKALMQDLLTGKVRVTID